MAPTSKAKAAGVSASSFLDLKAELAKHENKSSKTKGPRDTPIYAGPSKKPSQWARQNKGVSGRVAKDMIELEAVSKPTLEKARAVLERKAKIYEQLRKGKSAGLSEQQYEGLLVDFDQDLANAYASDSDDVDESFTVPKPQTSEEDDPIVEYEDEFGRIRTANRSEVPRHLAKPESSAMDEILGDDSDVIYNPVNHFPTYEPSAEKIHEIQASLAEENNPLNIHYDASAEVRAKGAAFYQFSGDEETRRKQMEELRLAREETERVRREGGAPEVRVGEVEGMTEDAASTKSRAMEKRKREVEERRRMIDAKRRKLKGGAPEEGKQPGGSGSTESKMGNPDESEPGPRPVQDSKSASKTLCDTNDPFVALEAQAMPSSSGTGAAKTKQKTEPDMKPVNAADAFLAQLEMDMLRRKS